MPCYGETMLQPLTPNTSLLLVLSLTIQTTKAWLTNNSLLDNDEDVLFLYQNVSHGYQ